MPIVRLFCDIHDQEIEANSMYLWGSCMWFRSVCGEFAVDIPQTYPGYTPEAPDLLFRVCACVSLSLCKLSCIDLGNQVAYRQNNSIQCP